MGKSRRSRGNAAHRKDPISKPVKPPSDPELAALRETKVLPVLKDLQSADPASRSTAATAISSIIQDSRCRKLLLREKIVHVVLTQTLTDAALESRAAGWGILQVLAQEEEADFCVHLFRLDVLTAIEHASKAVSEKLQSKDPGLQQISIAERDFTLSIVSSLVSLLTALAEAQDDILETISQNVTITNLLFTLVALKSPGDGDQATTGLQTDALACLMILCEDNPKLSERIVSGQGAECFQRMMSLKDDLTAEGTLSCATLHNIFAALAESDEPVQTPDADDSSIINALTKTVSTIQPGETMVPGGTWSKLECQVLALEVLASIGTSIGSSMGGPDPKPKPKQTSNGVKKDDGEGDEDMGDAEEEDIPSDQEDAAEEDDEMDEDEMEADMELVTGAGDDDDDIDSLPTLKAFVQFGLPQLIRVACIQPHDEDSIRVQSHALSALNNIAWSMAIVDFSDENNAGIQKAWVPVARTIWTDVIGPILSSDTADLNLATQVTGLAWATSRALHSDANSLGADQQYHRKFISLYQATRGAQSDDQEDPFQGLGVKCIGVLGQLALDPAPMDLNREIGTFLVTVIAGLPETPPADAVEALNQIFDIYADEGAACDREVFWKDNFAKHLEDALPKVRSMVKGVDRKAHAELRVKADEVVMNLTRFLAYKKKHKPTS